MACVVFAQGSDAPIITGFTPADGPPGTRVTIQGTDLTEVTGVRFNERDAEFGVLVAGSEVYAVVPINATSGPITVITPAGQSVSEQIFIVTTPDPPVVTEFTPATGRVGTSVTIKGANFVSVLAVQFNGHDASFSAFDSQTIIANVPSTATSGFITVTTAYGSFTTAQSFVVVADQAPVITVFSPDNGPVATAVMVEGTDLGPVTSVRFNGIEASFISLGSDRLSASVPAGATTGPITVSSPLGSFTTTSHFTVTLPPGPIIESFTPTTGRIGTPVLVLGANLNRTTAVKFNGVPATYVTYSPAMVYTTVPAGASTGPITVETMVGTSVSPSSFTVIREIDLQIAQQGLLDITNGIPQATFNLWITNLGPSQATGILVSNAFATGPNVTATNWPAVGLTNLVYQTIAFSQGTFQLNQGLLHWQPGNLAPGGQATLTLTVTGMDGGQLNSLAGVSALETDVAPTNNLSVVTVDVVLSAALAIARLPDQKVAITWPASSPRWVLQLADRVPSTGAVWNEADQIPSQVEGRYQVVTNATSAARFFRLIWR
jgi:hypothetical protein